MTRIRNINRTGSAPAAFRTLASAAVFLTAAAPAMADQGVIVSGIQTDFGEEINRGGGGGSFSVDDFCAASPMIGMALGDIVGGIESAMTNAGSPITMNMIESLPGAPNRVDVERDLSNARDQLCDNTPPETTVQPFVLTYSSCRMGMYTATHAMVISMPAESGDAYMLVADHTTRDVMHLNLTRRIDDVSEVLGSGWNNLIEINTTGQTSEHIGYPTEFYNFEHTSGMGESDLGALTEADVQAGAITSAQGIGNMVSTTTSGSAWISNSVPGIDIVQSFYQNLTTQMQADQGSSFFGGLIQNMVGMLDKGIPLEIETTVSSSVMGRTMISGKSKSVVGNIRLAPLRSDWCGEQPLPDGYTITDVDQQMSDAMSGAGAGSSPEMAEAMAEYNEAMQNMTPEQREMMEKMGLGSAMAAAGGGVATNPGGDTTSDAAAGLTENSNSNCAGSGVSSSELTTDDMTESVQKHLAALGYETGNTNGDESLMTTVSISQFQAENGKEVSGEISPQLLGALAAEVDKCN